MTSPPSGFPTRRLTELGGAATSGFQPTGHAAGLVTSGVPRISRLQVIE